MSKFAAWPTTRAAAIALLLFEAPEERFDPDEPRDEYGRWTEGGSGSGSDVGAPVPLPIDPAKVEAKTQANVAAAAAKALAAGHRPLPGSNATHPDTIASRAVTAKGSTPAYGQPDVASMHLDPENYEHDVGLFNNAAFYPNFRADTFSGTTDQAAQKIVDEMKSNLEFLFGFASRESQVWYDGARALVDDRAKLYGFNDASIAGVYAALSPGKEWDVNVHLADMLMDVYAKQQDHAWDEKMEDKAKTLWSEENQKVVDQVRGLKLSQLTTPAQKGLWIRTYNEAHSDRHYREVRPNGALGPFARGKPAKEGEPGKLKTAAWQSLPMISNAIKALEANGDRAKISAAFGGAHKVRSFYNNILDPHAANGDVTIDTHAVGAALLRSLGQKSVGVSHNFGTGNKTPGYEGASNSVKTGLHGTYPLYAEAYRQAAKELGVEPRQLQSAVWVVKREQFGKLTDKQDAEIEAAWQKYHDDAKVTLAQTQQAIAEIAGLKKPDAGRHYRNDGGSGRAGHARGLHQHELGQRRPALGRGAGSTAAGGVAGLDALRGAQRRAGPQEIEEIIARCDALGLRVNDPPSQSDLAEARRFLGRSGFDPDEPRDEEGRADTGRAIRQAAWARARRDAQRLMRSGFDPDEPRDESGKWTEGGGEGGSEGIEATHESKPSGGYAPQTFHELRSHAASTFHQAISEAKAASPHGAAVEVHTPEEYKGMRTFLAPDRKSGFALDGDNIVSVFKHPDATAKGVAKSALTLATRQGGRRLDAFDTVLPHLYSNAGFRAVARLPFDEKYAPAGWSKETFGKFNGGKPDVLFMVHDPEHAKLYEPGDGAAVASYEEGTKAQQAALDEIDRQNAERIIASVPGAKQAIAAAKAKQAGAVETKPASGVYPPERQELHKQILDKIFTPERVAAATPAKGEKPTLHLMGGSGGSGKSYFSRAGRVPIDKAIYINSDDVKEALPEYKGYNAPQVHEEASDIAGIAEANAQAKGLNVILDGTMGSMASLERRVASYKAAGYRVEGHFMRVTPQTSAKRALERFVRGGPTGRYVPPEMLLKHNANANFAQARGKMDKYEIYQNEGSAPKFVGRGP